MAQQRTFKRLRAKVYLHESGFFRLEPLPHKVDWPVMHGKAYQIIHVPSGLLLPYGYDNKTLEQCKWLVIAFWLLCKIHNINLDVKAATADDDDYIRDVIFPAWCRVLSQSQLRDTIRVDEQRSA